MISIGNHIIARLGLRNLKDFADIFNILEDANIINAESAKIYLTMARFRNRIVHIYWDVDLDEVYKIMEHNLIDFERYIKDITERFL